MMNDLIQTLSVDQLLVRSGWERFSKQNILEMADEGCFGLYTQPKRDRATHCDVANNIKNLINQSERLMQLDDAAQEQLVHAGVNPKEEYAAYVQLEKNLLNFTKKCPALLIEKTGYERLATKIETQLNPSTLTGSVGRLIRDGKIQFGELSQITFGFTLNNGVIQANSYNLFSCHNPVTGKLPEGCKGFYSIEDLFLFVKQIKEFESKEEFFHMKKDRTKSSNTKKTTKDKLSASPATKPWKRENTLKIAYAVIIMEIKAAIPFASSIYEKVDKRKGDSKILANDGGRDLISRWILATSLPLDKPDRYNESQNEIIWGVMCNIAFKKKDQISNNSPRESTSKIQQEVIQVLTDCYQIKLTEEEFQSLSADSISAITGYSNNQK